MDKNSGLYYRSFAIDVRAIDEDKRSVDVSFSSETPVQRFEWEPPDILLHGPDNVDLSTLDNLGSILMNHQPRGPGQPVEIVGKPTNNRIENRRGMTTIVFDDDEEGNRAFLKVKSGSLRGISVGAAVTAVTEVKVGETIEGFDGPVNLAVKWKPHEISLTPIPADTSVGVERSLSDIHNETTNQRNPNTEENDMEAKDVQAMITKSLTDSGFIKKEDLTDFGVELARSITDGIKEDAKPKMQFDTEILGDLLNRASAVSVECKSKVSDMAVEGKPEVEILRTINDMTGDPDALDAGEGEGDPIEGDDQNKNLQRAGEVKSFEGVEDDDFIGGFTKPQYTIN